MDGTKEDENILGGHVSAEASLGEVLVLPVHMSISFLGKENNTKRSIQQSLDVCNI